MGLKTMIKSQRLDVKSSGSHCEETRLSGATWQSPNFVSTVNLRIVHSTLTAALSRFAGSLAMTAYIRLFQQATEISTYPPNAFDRRVEKTYRPRESVFTAIASLYISMYYNHIFRRNPALLLRID
jgi:hypothetical protein